MTRRVTLAQIETDVADCVRAAEQGDTVLVTRNGEAVVVLISAREMEHLAGKTESPAEGLASLAGGWEGSEELVERISESRRTPPRAGVDLD